MEDYLKGLLKAIRPALGVVSLEDDTGVAALSRRKYPLSSFRFDVASQLTNS